jgi:hypothetical protein
VISGEILKTVSGSVPDVFRHSFFAGLVIGLMVIGLLWLIV